MKRIFLTIALVLLTCLNIFGQTIIVIRPESQYRYWQGQKMDIVWLKSSSGSMNEFVKISLFNAQKTEEIFIIDENAYNIYHDHDHPYVWKPIPYSIPPGKYTIRVKTIDGAVSGFSGKFTIWGYNSAEIPNEVTKSESSVKNTPKIHPKNIFKPTLRIKVIQPHRSDVLYEGKYYYIEWENSFTKSKPIKVELYNLLGNKFIKSIRFRRRSLSIGKTTKIKWLIRKGEFNTKEKYRIKISRNDVHNISGLSGAFAIRKLPLSFYKK